MNCNWQLNRFSVLLLLPWLAFLAILEQGPALQFYPDSNFAQEAELVDAASYTDPVLSLEDLSISEYSVATGLEYPSVVRFISDQASPLPSFTHLYSKALVVSWIQARSQGYLHG